MRSVADELRETDAEAFRALPIQARVELARALGERGLAVFAEASGLTIAEARLELRRRKQVGRTPSRCAAP